MTVFLLSRRSLLLRANFALTGPLIGKWCCDMLLPVINNHCQLSMEASRPSLRRGSETGKEIMNPKSQLMVWTNLWILTTSTSKCLFPPRLAVPIEDRPGS